MSDIWGSLFGGLLGGNAKPPEDPDTHYRGKIHEYKGQKYQLIRREEQFMGTWYAIPVNEGQPALPATVALIYHPPTARWQEDLAETEHRVGILRDMYGHSKDYPTEHCTKQCAYERRHSYKVHRPEGQDEYPSLWSELCPEHQAHLRTWLERHPKYRLPDTPKDPRMVEDGSPQQPPSNDRMSLLMGDDG